MINLKPCKNRKAIPTNPGQSTWTPKELEAVLGNEDAEVAARYFDVTDSGNFEGRSILNIKAPAAAVAYGCEKGVCRLPSLTAEDFAEQLRQVKMIE